VKLLLLLPARPLAAQLAQQCWRWGLLLLGLTAAGAAPLLNGWRCAQLRMLPNFVVCIVRVVNDACLVTLREAKQRDPDVRVQCELRDWASILCKQPSQ
jgi:hypothetical protein